MEPEIRYCKTRDGVNIAYYTIGRGPALVVTRIPTGHTRLEWGIPSTRAMYESIARVATLVRFDHRGFGLSDRGISDFSLELMVSDLEAVVESLGLSRISLIGNSAASPIAVAYAGLHSDVVTRLVLQPGFVRSSGRAWSQWKQLATMAPDDWEFASEAMLRSITGWGLAENAQAEARILRETTTPSLLAMYLEYAEAWDASRYVPHVTAPTLLTEIPEASYTTTENARSLAAALPDARLVVLTEGTRSEQSAQAITATARFLGGANVLERPSESSSTAIILFADIVDSTATTERIGDAAFHERSRPLDAELRRIVGECGGTAIDARTLGDGVLATFPAAAQAVNAGVRCAAAGERVGLPLHVGIHAGDVIRDANNVFGGAVIVASRISGLSTPGEVLVSDVVRALARTSASVTFEDRGEHALKGVGEPQRVYAVRAAQGGG